MIKPITDNLMQFSFNTFSSNCYLLYYKNKKIMIDNGSPKARKELLADFNSIKTTFDDIDLMLLTHLHWDHCGNTYLFKNAKVYASKTEIEDFRNNKTMIYSTPTKHSQLISELERVKFHYLSELKINGLKVIEVPGHTAGSVAFYLPKEKILFSGDTIFDSEGSAIGRTDLPTSVPEKMASSVKKLLSLDFKILCPGHYNKMKAIF